LDRSRETGESTERFDKPDPTTAGAVPQAAAKMGVLRAMRRREYTLSLRRPFLNPANLEQSAVFLRKASLFVTINLPAATLNHMGVIPKCGAGTGVFGCVLHQG
jgi:hypothetical protein